MLKIQAQVKAMQQDRGMVFMQRELTRGGEGSRIPRPSSSCVAHDQAKTFILTGDVGLKDLLMYSLEFYDKQVLFCQGNTKALVCSTINPFDCIIIDCDTPGMDGIDHIRQLREQFASAIIIGLCKEDRGVPYLQAGMNDFLQKPFSPYRLAMMMDGGDLLA